MTQDEQKHNEQAHDAAEAERTGLLKADNENTKQILQDLAVDAYLSVANEPRPMPPETDDPASATDLINFTLDRCLELTDALYRYANVRFEEAPISSRKTIELASTIADVVVDAVRGWEG